MMRKIVAGLLCFILLANITSCSDSRKQNGEGTSEVVSLAVYMVAQEMSGSESYIFTPYSMGDYNALLSAYGEKGYRYYEVLKTFEAEYPIELDITYFQFTDDLEMQLENDIENGTLPDVIIEDSMSEVDAYRWFESDLFLDMAPYALQDSLYDSGAYYNEVLKAGMHEEHQLIMPLAFNMNTIMSSDESLGRQILSLEDNTLDELIVQLTGVAERMRLEGGNQEVLSQNYSPITEFPIVVLLSAAGQEYIDYKAQSVNLDQQWFETLAKFYKAFAMQEAKDFDELISTGEEFYLSDTWHDERKFSEEDFGFFSATTAAYIEGGGCYNSEVHSFAAQANYYESRYKDIGETFILQGVPTYQNAAEYTAVVTNYAGIMSTTKHPEEAYTFIKYLMDQSNFMHFELSVNKVATQEMLDMLTNTEYTVSQLNGYLEAGMTLDSDPTAYVMKPMSKETKDEINKMLDNISYATLPNWPVYNIIMENMEDYVVGDADLEECYSNAVAELDEYAGMIYQ